MRSTIMALTAATSLSLTGWGAQAMPARLAGAAPAVSHPLTLVAQGCGPGFRLTPRGVCRPIGGPVVVGRPVVVARPAVVVRPGCGVRVGPIGVRTPC